MNDYLSNVVYLDNQQFLIESPELLGEDIMISIDDKIYDLKGLRVLDFKFSKEALDYLWDLVNNYDKEIGGSLELKRTQRGVLVYPSDNFSIGRKEEVDIKDDKITFHTHPRVTYKKYNIFTGWPSQEDYFHLHNPLSKGITLFHCTIALEGIYIVSLNPFGEPFSRKDIHQRIGDMFKNGDRHTPEEYLERMKGSYFNVDLIEWEDRDIIRVFYRRP